MEGNNFSYHIRTNEPDKYDSLHLDYCIVDSIFVPSREILVGFLKQEYLKGIILNYDQEQKYDISDYYSRALDIVDGNRNGVRGEVISSISLKTTLVDKIENNTHEHELELISPFNGETERLIEILTGASFRRNGKMRRALSYLKNIHDVVAGTEKGRRAKPSIA